MNIKLKKTIIIGLFIYLINPNKVFANITCNDGTLSPSCYDCHQGCCSHHGGCLNNENTYDNTEENENVYREYGKDDDKKYEYHNDNNKNEYRDDDKENKYLYLFGLGGASACGYYFGKKKK